MRRFQPEPPEPPARTGRGAELPPCSRFPARCWPAVPPRWAACCHPLPAPGQLRQARSGRGMALTGEGRRRPDGARPGAGAESGFTGRAEVLQLTQAVPASIASSAESVAAAHRDYQELQLGRPASSDLYPDADPVAAARAVRRDRPGLFPRRATGAAAADPGRRHPGGGGRRLRAARHGRSLRRTRRADPFLQQHDAPAERGARPGRPPSRTKPKRPRPTWNPCWPICRPACWPSTCASACARPTAAPRPSSATTWPASNRPPAGLAAPRDAGRRHPRKASHDAATSGRSNSRLARPDSMPQALLVRGTACRRRRRRLRGGVRRHHQADRRTAFGRLGRGGAAPGARDQEPADADPACRPSACNSSWPTS
jgi:hypothetical protein